ncbi:hypothetical protein MTP99_011194 [Tenebrio molitor]|uniref:phospholipase A2-like n=1 Tax=Tenebrio molitor TaxID=7067 RepID=UPI001C3B3BC7|nr:hypothetical protein MTP99_011194 [Tenebrio molitor]CAH1369783.1 unnamed protein product [Tenebrio molitor]
MLFKTVLLVFLIGVCLLQHDSLAQKSIVGRFVPQEVQEVLVAEEDNKVDLPDREEHGTLDFFGRDFIRKASRKIGEWKNAFKVRFSRDTQGLDCNKTLSEGKVDKFKSRVKAIYPGTKWCGDGNISKSYDDLGKYSVTDKCCREHDLCPDNIPADSTKYDLVNTGLFTRSHCDCDRKFYECLKNANNVVARSIGFTYFTVLGPQCFRYDYPIHACMDKQRGKCVAYAMNRRQSKMYQWFDCPKF